MALVDELIGGFDRALRAIAGVHRPARPSPADPLPEEERLSEAERAHSAALMRVNHVGEICAQALYEGQALVARGTQTRASLRQASKEEEDHLAWCAERIAELEGRTSLLNPLWYAGSFALGVAAGATGDRWSLAFLAETERQVEEHLSDHLSRLSAHDERSRRIIEAMRLDEAQHRETAIRLGGTDLPQPIRLTMRAASRIMTTVSFRV